MPKSIVPLTLNRCYSEADFSSDARPYSRLCLDMRGRIMISYVEFFTYLEVYSASQQKIISRRNAVRRVRHPMINEIFTHAETFHKNRGIR